MGFVGQLKIALLCIDCLACSKFALLCIDCLAWPVIALVYPLFASIRAIETGSKYHTEKLVIYWTLFSLISMFEYAFVKIIEWVPFWSGIKLTAFFWLAIPRFHGACYAYKSFVRPFLVVKLQELISRFEEQHRADTETFIVVADKYIQENGCEGLEKLIATKRKCKEADNSQRDNQLIESDEKNDVSTSKQLKEPIAARKDNEMSKTSEKSELTEAKQAQTLTTSNLDTKETTTFAAVVTKGILETPPIPEIRKPVTPVMPDPLKKLVKGEWTCSLCGVTTNCKNNLKDHLGGKKHKAMVDALKSSKLNAQGLGIGKSARPDRGGVTRHWCFACDVELVGAASLASHLNGKRHASNVMKNGLT